MFKTGERLKMLSDQAFSTTFINLLKKYTLADEKLKGVSLTSNNGDSPSHLSDLNYSYLHSFATNLGSSFLVSSFLFSVPVAISIFTFLTTLTAVRTIIPKLLSDAKTADVLASLVSIPVNILKGFLFVDLIYSLYSFLTNQEGNDNPVLAKFIDIVFANSFSKKILDNNARNIELGFANTIGKVAHFFNWLKESVMSVFNSDTSSRQPVRAESPPPSNGSPGSSSRSSMFGAETSKAKMRNSS